MRLTRILVSLCAVGLVGCGDMFFVEVELPEVCINTVSTDFPANPLGPAAPQTLDQQYDYDLGSALGQTGLSGLDSEIGLTQATFTVADGVDNLEFIEKVSLKIAPPSGSSLPERELLRYERGAAPVTRTVTLEGDTMDIMAYLKQDRIQINSSFTGQFPSNAWSMQVKTCVYARGKYNYLQGM